MVDLFIDGAVDDKNHEEVQIISEDEASGKAPPPPTPTLPPCLPPRTEINEGGDEGGQVEMHLGDEGGTTLPEPWTVAGRGSDLRRRPNLRWPRPRTTTKGPLEWLAWRQVPSI